MYGRNGNDGMRGHRGANGRPARGDAEQMNGMVGMTRATTRRHAALLLGALFAAGGLAACGEGADGAEGGSGDPTARLLPNVPAEERDFLFSWAGFTPNARSKDGKYRLNWVECREYYRPGAERQGTGYERACLYEFPVIVSKNLRRLGYEVEPRDAVTWRICVWRKRETKRVSNLPRRERKAYYARRKAWLVRHGLTKEK